VRDGLVVMELGEDDRVCAPDTGVGSGGEVKIIVRPERMRVWGDPDGERISRVRGTIAEVVYLGSMTQLIIDLKTGERVTVHELNDDLKGALPQSGDPVVVQWAAESSFVIDDTGAVNVAAATAAPE
jgi:spermidine/putrescine transport system ATP-binding protein